jgi:hypothetical protein
MAERRIRGTLTRNSWDFYENACAIGNVNGSVPPGALHLGFVNNAMAPGNLDVYRTEISVSAPLAMSWYIAGPDTSSGAVFQIPGVCYPMDPLQATPPGFIGTFTSPNLGVLHPVRIRQDPLSFDTMQLLTDGPFLTLSPGYWLVCDIGPTANIGFSLSVWYQWLLDLHPPA